MRCFTYSSIEILRVTVWCLLWTHTTSWLMMNPSQRVSVHMKSTAEEEQVLTPSSEAADSLALSVRGKVNEIDFCIAPADVSLSRAAKPAATQSDDDAPGMSLTRALNNASNRAVRRILLARSWPSAEALNLSFRQAAASAAAASKSKCPVPQPILNVLTRNRDKKNIPNKPKARSRTDSEYVADQLQSFRQRYGSLPGYSYAGDYLECILALATNGVESSKAETVLKDGVYDESYRRVLSVLATAGIQWNATSSTDISPRGMLKEFNDQDICCSMMDKIQMKKEASADQDVSEDEERDSLGGVLLSAKEPTLTRQLNQLSNIVQRALLFGGDQELLVLAETLDADRPAFVSRWYPNTGDLPEDAEEESRPGVQYLNSLVQLLRNCFNDGVVTDLDPPLPLINSYANAYERLVATAVELGSGYLKPADAAGAAPIPRTAQEELGRFAVWESQFRQQSSTIRDVSSHPEDLEGSWMVRDEIGGETIGTSVVTLLKEGPVQIPENPGWQGLRWRLDPGPTHLDTCTFQVLNQDDGTILQYRGFIDRGARLEARFSQRSITIRGNVQFQMRQGSVDYYQDMLPINYRQGTTKFVMTKKVD